ncbi:MAG: penicillin-binding transpeptidase domain-containing protein [Christensenellaceae bacterium]
MDNRTHGFKAYYSTVGPIRRLPGSLIKPLLVYAPALEEDLISPATPVLDEKTDFGGYEPKNFSGTYSGYISVRESLAKSVNIPAVKILNSTGVSKAAEYMKKLGLEIPADDYSLALALGGMKEGFSLNELINAYSAFPNGGEYFSSGFIRKIVIDGRSAYHKNDRAMRVFSDDTAYLINDMLKTAAQSGTAKN